MNPLLERHVAVLRELRTLWPEDRLLVIGAAAVACQIGLTWRGTVDLDLSIATGLAGYARKLESLGWRQERGASQRWTTKRGDLVDVVPGAPALVRRGVLTWPEGGGAMSLIGFRLAFADATPLALSPRTRVRVASLRSLLVLKMAAYLDRPWERESDLEDLAHMLFRFLSDEAPERWSDRVVGLGLDFEDVGPYLSGEQIGALADRAERGLVGRFLGVLLDPGDRLATLPRMALKAPPGWREPERLGRRWLAFRRGFESRRSQPRQAPPWGQRCRTSPS